MLIESITLAQRDNKELEALIYRFRPLIRKCGRQLHIEDGEQEMVVAFIELIKRFRPERLRSQDDGKVVQYIKNAMNYSCFKIYKKHHNPIATIISLEEITVKEEAAYLTGSDQSQDMQLDQTFQLDLLTEKELFLMFEKSISAAAIARRWGCSRQSVNQIKLKALNKLKSQISAHSSSGGGDSK